MGTERCEMRIGTSGWHYDHWRGRFYPETLAKSKWFEHYARHFDTVEINNTFYRLPKTSTVESWRAKAPPGFLYVVKANRYITHIKRLKDTAEQVRRFFDVVGLFEDTLGPVLYQLPPSLHKDLGLLGDFLHLLPQRPKAVFEFRHESWYAQDTFDLLHERGVALCVHDMTGRESPRVVTGETVYVRFHGTSGRYAGNYPDAMLEEWARWLQDQAATAGAVYAYFNNDVAGHAIHNATTLKRILGVA
jgi:uncharacterized protein YecE (DUF72 family)